MTGAPAPALGALDDYPIHQAADVFSAVTPAAGGWTERFYFNAFRPSGELAFIAGGGVYPGRGLAECYFCRIEGDRQVNVRAWQPAPERRQELEAGGFSISCETPLRDWAVRVDLEEDRLAGRFLGTLPPFLYRPIDIAADEPGGPFDAFRHFVALGRWELAAAPSGAPEQGLLGIRDRTWGVRTRRPRLHLWSVLALGDACLAVKHQERADGSVLFSEAGLTHADGRVEAFAVERHELEFDPHERQIARGRLDLGSPGGALTVEFERAGQGIRLAGAGYDDRQGDRGTAAGLQRDVFELADPEVAARVGRGTIDAGVRARAGGVLEAEGAGVVETAVARDHVRYGVQVSPPR